MELNKIFKDGLWSNEINVRDFVSHNITPYYGDVLSLKDLPNVQKPYGTVALKHWQKKEKTTVSARLITLLYLPFHHTKPDISTKKTN